MKKINESEVKLILHSYETRRMEIHKRILSMIKELGETDGMIYEMSVSSPGITDMPKQKGEIKDLYEVFSRYQKSLRERALELDQGIRQLTEEEEALNRVWSCCQALRGEEYDVLRRLFILRQPWKTVEIECGMSSGSIQRIQKRALQKIIDMYNSPYSITEINSHSESYKKERERDGGGDYQQLRLFE